jgi:hypothetical protein
MKLTRNHYPVRYKRASFFSADNDSYMDGSHLKKVSANETRMYTLCTLNGKELDTGHSSSPNSELSYFEVYVNYVFLYLPHGFVEV